MTGDCVIILVTCASKGEARKIAGSILKKRLAACANIAGAVESRFWWKGRLDGASETILMMKSRKANFRKIEAEVKRLHSYEVPEIIAVPVIDGSRDYLDWIGESVK
jgi:periplasmic divalent cation tolerance protein